jgi:hypothetical protein
MKVLYYKNGNDVFYVVRAEMFKYGQSSSGVEVLSCQQFSWVSDVKEWGISVVSWKAVCEEKTERWVWNGHQRAASYKISAGAAVTRGPERAKLKYRPLCWNRCQETASGDCDKLRTLLCVYRGSVKCSYDLCVQVVNKSNIKSISRLQSRTPNTWQ